MEGVNRKGGGMYSICSLHAQATTCLEWDHEV